MHIGTSVGPYRILNHLGSGGMGEVWLAEDTRLQRRVALKMVRAAAAADAMSRERLMREARAAAALNHPHIATVHDVLEEQGEVVIVFEYVEGETLHARIARERIPADDAVDIATQIARALAAAHAHGIVHRDLKPANVIIGADRHVKVLDFGIARMLAVGTTQTTAGAPPITASGLGFIGTASYAAPEQMVSSAVDERADLYALGVVLFEMISGRRPFQGSDPVQLATSKLGTAAPPLSSTGQLVAAPLERLVAALLERDRDKRPASAHDVVSELKAISGSSSSGGLPPVPKRTSSVLMIVAAAALVLATGIAVWSLRDRSTTSGSSSSAPPVIAVLPLTNNSGDPARDFVAAGIAESLIASLATLPRVTVLSRQSVTEARSRVKDGAALTKDLGASYLVEGSVQESGGTLRVSLNLVRPDRSVAWGDSIEGQFERIFELQSRLASALTNALVVRVSASEREALNTQPTSSPQAMSAYWRGRALLERGDVAGNREAAIASLIEATQLDPAFAIAYSALGRAYWDKYGETKDPVWTQKALDAGATGLRLNADLPEVRYGMAVILSGTGRLDEAEQELSKALARQPNYDDARRMLGQVLARQGKIDAAVAEYRKAIALRPAFGITYSSLGNALFAAARYEEAIDAFKSVTALQPDNNVGFQQLGTAYQAIGRNAEARESYQKAIAIRPSAQAYSNLGTLEYQRGAYQEAADAYRAAIKLRPLSAPTHRNLGDALLKLGQAAPARAAFTEAVRLTESDLKVNPTDARTIAALAVFLAKAGQPEAAGRRIAEARSRDEKNVDVLFRSAVVEAVLNRPDAAMTYLNRAVAAGYSRASIASADEFEVLRSRSEFQRLVKPPAQ